MQQHQHLKPLGRHARLFELIRQRNLADMASAAMAPSTQPNPAEAQLFLAKAQRSFQMDRPAEDTFKFAV